MPPTKTGFYWMEAPQTIQPIHITVTDDGYDVGIMCVEGRMSGADFEEAFPDAVLTPASPPTLSG